LFPACAQAYAEEERRLHQEKLERMAALRAQMEEQNQTKAISRANRFGGIDQNDSVFSKFGTSVR